MNLLLLVSLASRLAMWSTEWKTKKAINIPHRISVTFLTSQLISFVLDYGFITSDRLRLILCQFCRLLIAIDRLILRST